jgi:hypothetical protein
MAEIRIERKRRGLGLVWLFLALVLVALLAWYFLYPGTETTAPATAPPATGTLERTSPAIHGSASSVRPTATFQAQAGSLRTPPPTPAWALGCEVAARNPRSRPA